MRGHAISRFIDPRTLASIGRLPLLAKTVVDGFMLGMHHSKQVGVGLEFNQYRSYEPGDDLRRVDWKLFARSGRYYVRESDLETSITVRFVLDATASMLHEEEGVSKFDYARFLVASLGYLTHNQGDQIGLQLVSGDELIELPPRHHAQQLHRFFHYIEHGNPSGKWPSRDQLSSVFTADGRRSVVVFVSDMHEAGTELMESIASLRTLQNDVIVFHLMGGVETDFSYKGRITFEELETNRRLHSDTDHIRVAYLAAQQEAHNTLRQSLYERRVAYEPIRLDQPLDMALRYFLSRRSGIHV